MTRSPSARLAPAAVLASLWFLAPAALGQASFTGCGFLPGGDNTLVRTVSPDGRTAAGRANGWAGSVPFWWKPTSGGAQPYPSFGPATTAIAEGVTDGGYTAGEATNTVTRITTAWRFEPSGVIAWIAPPFPHVSSAAKDISDSGAVVVGFSTDAAGARWPWRWTPATGLVSIAPTVNPPGDWIIEAAPRAVSGDGATAVGYLSLGLAGEQPARWRAAAGFVRLDVAAIGSGGVATDASYDGSVVVGFVHTAAGERAFRWTESGGAQMLGTLPGDALSSAWGVSADGQTVVGRSTYVDTFGTAYTRTFVWTPSTGMRSLNDILAARGISTAGWSNLAAARVSADGQRIAGSGIDPAGRLQAFLAVTGGPGACCAADFNCSGAADVSDIFAFLTAWFSTAATADADRSGVVNVNDIFTFLSAWFRGC